MVPLSANAPNLRLLPSLLRSRTVMALTQLALRLPGPSWDEEVVPALRKRLQTESRTLSKRMSAISLSGDDAAAASPPSPGSPTTSTPHHHRQRQPNGSNSLDYSSSASASRTPNAAKKPGPNGSAFPSSADFARSRTYSQPDFPNSSSAMTRGPNGSNPSSRSRPSDPKPTRIPKPSRAYTSYSNGNTPVVPQTNGFAHPSDYPTEQQEARPPQFTSTSNSRSTVGLAHNRSTSGLLNESPPFPPSTSATSLAQMPPANGYHDPDEEETGGRIDVAPSRDSMESVEQPFEHWYRGEVSRNGGVGELRVGRRQEMLEIANYGHMIRNHHIERKASPVWRGSALYRPPAEDRTTHSGRGRHRKRAGSIAGLTEVDRVRGSVYFDEEGMNAVGRVLDECPLTDLDDDHASDVASLASYSRVHHDYILGVGDISTTSAATPTPLNESEGVESTPRLEDRSTTPTFMSTHSQPIPRNGHPPSRIPAPRRSSDSRAATPTMNNSTRSANASTSSSKTPSPPPIPPSGSRTISGSTYTSGQLVSGKRGISPATPSVKKRVVAKSLRGKQGPPALAKKDPRESISQYPSPEGDEDDMADAIPSWTQPVPRQGNWDEVVLPVVARNKGMGEHYETADGSPQPRKPPEKRIAPAPGTFGYDHSKIRTRHSDEFIPMDEFGRPEQPTREEGEEDIGKKDEQTSGSQQYDDKHNQTPLPIRGSPPPSPPPFSHYRPQIDQNNTPPPPAHTAGPRLDDQMPEEESPGCCKCTVM